MSSWPRHPLAGTVVGMTTPIYASDVDRHRDLAKRRRTRWLATVLWAVLVALVARVLSGASPLPTFTPPNLELQDWVLVSQLLFFGLIVLVLLGWLIMRAFRLGNRPKAILPSDLGVTLADVRGLGPIVDDVRRTIELFRAYKTFREVTGGTVRRAILFTGPPGTGKTYTAKAIAAEAGVPFLATSGTGFKSSWYGGTERKIRAFFRDLRKLARKHGGAVGFIDEIDAAGRSRSSLSGRSGADPTNELLVQLDSIHAPDWNYRIRAALAKTLRREPTPYEEPNVLVVAATNHVEALDPALVRSGRFGTKIAFTLPDKSARAEILAYYLDRKRNEDVDVDALAAVTVGYSPADLEALLDEALIWAYRDGRQAMTWADLQQARLSKSIGTATPAEYTEEERHRVATHEAGHAVVSHILSPENRIDVVSILRRGHALGVTVRSPRVDSYIMRPQEVGASLAISLAGGAAEEIAYGDHSSTVGGDYETATALATSAIARWGMGETLYRVPDSRLEGDSDTRRQVEELLEEAHSQAEEVLTEHWWLVELLRDALIEHGELVGDDVYRVLAGLNVKTRENGKKTA